MAIDSDTQNKGVGTKLLEKMEIDAKKAGATRIILNGRKTAVGFYERNGYNVTGEEGTRFETVEHFKMEKRLK